MKRYEGFEARTRKRYLLVVVFTLAPLVWSLAEHERDAETDADSVQVVGWHTAAPDHAMLMASDVERALPVPQHALPGSPTPTIL